MQVEVDLSKWNTAPKKQTKISVGESTENISLCPRDWKELSNKNCYSTCANQNEVLQYKWTVFRFALEFLDSGVNEQPLQGSLKMLFFLLKFLYSNGLNDACVIF